MFDYHVEFPRGSDTVILIAPNGFGKTALLTLINACLQFRFSEAVEHSFMRLDVTFDDGRRWSFEKQKPQHSQVMRRNERAHFSARTRAEWQRFHEIVKLRMFGRDGKEQKDQAPATVAEIPPELLARALDRSLPVVREGRNTFRDLRTEDVVPIETIFERYRDVLLNDPTFLESFKEYGENIWLAFERPLDCVFIETQRLMISRKLPRPRPDQDQIEEEEIRRQARKLSRILQVNYSNYASISQDLDRSFPNRLVARAASLGPDNIERLKEDLASIESRRQALTEAGILVETAEPLVPPEGKFLPAVAAALEIYAADSKAKLSTFDAIYPKVSVFRDLLAKKLKPKTLQINRENGAEVFRGDIPVKLEGLSSGEKHEFIMLFRLIFETPENALVLIDEPEISLHVLWQLEFMSDLRRIQSANKFQSIIATHSPQIIQGSEDIIIDLSEQNK